MAVADPGLGVEYLTTNDFFDFVLNDHFMPYVADTVIDPNVLSSRLPDKSEWVEGKDIVYPIHTGRNLAVGGTGVGGLLPDPGAQQYERYAFQVRSVYVRIKFDGWSKDFSRTEMDSWLRVVESETKGAARDLARQKQRMYHNDGSGRLAQLSASIAPAATTANVDAPNDLPDVGNMADFPATRFIRVGQRVAFITNSGESGAPTSAADSSIFFAATVVTVPTATSFTFTPGMTAGRTCPDNAFVVTVNTLSGLTNFPDTTNLSATGFLNEPMGISGIFRDSDPLDGTATGYQGIDSDAAANAFHRANVVTPSGAPVPVTAEQIDLAFTTSLEVGDVVPTAIYGAYGMIRSVAANVLPDRRYAPQDNLDAGYEVRYNTVPFIADRDAYNNRLYFAYEPDIGKFVNTGPVWIDDDGGVFHRIPDRHAFQASLYCRDTLGVDVRDRQTLLVGLETGIAD